jgi:hypothetical protein
MLCTCAVGRTIALVDSLLQTQDGQSGRRSTGPRPAWVQLAARVIMSAMTASPSTASMCAMWIMLSNRALLLTMPVKMTSLRALLSTSVGTTSTQIGRHAKAETSAHTQLDQRMESSRGESVCRPQHRLHCAPASTIAASIPARCPSL